MGNLGIGELAIIALIAVVLFGANKFSDIGKGLGHGRHDPVGSGWEKSGGAKNQAARTSLTSGT